MITVEWKVTRFPALNTGQFLQWSQYQAMLKYIYEAPITVLIQGLGPANERSCVEKFFFLNK